MEYKCFRTLQQRPPHHVHYYSTFLLQCFSASSVRCIPPAMLSGVKWPLSCCQKKKKRKYEDVNEGRGRGRKNRLLLERVSCDTSTAMTQGRKEMTETERNKKRRRGIEVERGGGGGGGGGGGETASTKRNTEWREDAVKRSEGLKMARCRKKWKQSSLEMPHHESWGYLKLWAILCVHVCTFVCVCVCVSACVCAHSILMNAPRITFTNRVVCSALRSPQITDYMKLESDIVKFNQSDVASYITTQYIL